LIFTCNNEQRAASNEQRAASSEQQAMSSEQRDVRHAMPRHARPRQSQRGITVRYFTALKGDPMVNVGKPHMGIYANA